MLFRSPPLELLLIYIGNKRHTSSINGFNPHADSEGLNTEVLVLEGSKYWIVGTEFGEDGIICSFDSLGPSWNPYVFNRPDKAKHFLFEAVHLQKGDML